MSKLTLDDYPDDIKNVARSLADAVIWQTDIENFGRGFSKEQEEAIIDEIELLVAEHLLIIIRNQRETWERSELEKWGPNQLELLRSILDDENKKKFFKAIAGVKDAS